MPVIAEPDRLPALRRLGLSPALLRLAAGQAPHPALARCLSGPPFYLYRGAHSPPGSPLVPLWDLHDQALAVRAATDALEFLRFSIEAPAHPEHLARTEAGFWATQFDALYELDLDLDALHAAAQAVGYRHLALQLGARDAYEREDAAHPAWLSGLVARIDALQV
ncbi:hypothetical protein [Nannocystis bainbridge]|uniref:Uncharacterized protein n=1 Tax=Nannocystis bainbridge TaxID=2995303 RepID=A0ABT5DS85_9BACT|nr:hypothetical protein [Nannocystis bainbridge]MDC0716512.1 hypothetical protein [Nannocystis bainbridge]